ncbi:hypothetical protein BpHYR1_019417 [Brachionus plicatilis]|uniref:Uncharacterized protein n=1 Tax=Brachionus plicatilis TaxID=10195 RepID=A0A3M7RD23_BRAPC|nr:hypothetical protein BpHYR1_019417 [Brachionus plicatilis]
MKKFKVLKKNPKPTSGIFRIKIENLRGSNHERDYRNVYDLDRSKNKDKGSTESGTKGRKLY